VHVAHARSHDAIDTLDDLALPRRPGRAFAGLAVGQALEKRADALGHLAEHRLRGLERDAADQVECDCHGEFFRASCE
jgi:hypothetical protein